MESTGLADSCVQALVAISDECGWEGAADSAEFGRWQPQEVCTVREHTLALPPLSNADPLQGRGIPLSSCSSVTILPRKRPDIMIRRRVFLSKERTQLPGSSDFQASSPAEPCKQRALLVELLARKPLAVNSGRTVSFAHLAVGKRIFSLSCPSVKPLRPPNQASYSLLSLQPSLKDSPTFVSPVRT